jgi:hypothetical protein
MVPESESLSMGYPGALGALYIGGLWRLEFGL